MSSQFFDFAAWYLASAAAGVLALPLTFRFFHRLPDRGYSFSKLTGILVAGYVFWLLGSLGLVYNDTGGLALSAGLTAGIGLAWLKKPGLYELAAWIKRERATVLVVELVFLAAFALWALVRAYNPEIEGTEKPMEFMFINSVLRSPTMPPHDAWLSGHAISYYYFGFFLVAAITRLAGTTPSIAFNLGISLLFALTAVASLGMSLNLISLARSRQADLVRSFRPALLAPLLVLLVGNYYGILEFAHNNGMLRNVQVPAVWYDFGQPPTERPAQSLADFERQPGIAAGLTGLWEWLDLKQLNQAPPENPGPLNYDLPNWFWSARVVHDRNLVGVETEAIDEHPAFSFLLADMHPHVLALPFVFLGMAVALEWLLWGHVRSYLDPPASVLRTVWPRLLFSGVVLGGLAFLNTWDFPIYLFLTVLALASGIGLSLGWTGLVRKWLFLAQLAAGLAITSVVLYLPFYLTLQSQAGGVLPNLIYPTRFQQTVVHFGPVMAGPVLLLAWAWRRWRRSFDTRAALWAGLGILLMLAVPVFVSALLARSVPWAEALVQRFIYPLTWDEAFSLFLQRRLVDSLATIFPAVLISLSAGLLVGIMRRSEAVPDTTETLEVSQHIDGEEGLVWQSKPGPPVEERDFSPGTPAVMMALAMVLTGALLLLGPEYVYLRDLFGSRMNTLFKFYFQIWALWAVAGTFGFWYVSRWAASRAGRIAVSLAVLLILPGLVYLPGSLLAKTRGFAGPPTLDGMEKFARLYPDDYAAILWLQENVEGRPVILEGSRGSYWMEGRSSRFSMATGLPTLVGWIGHEQQWRGEYYWQQREREDVIPLIYRSRSWNEVEPLLDEYQIEYIIVSPLERSWYDPVYMPKFDIYMDRVFDQGSAVIFRRR